MVSPLVVIMGTLTGDCDSLIEMVWMSEWMNRSYPKGIKKKLYISNGSARHKWGFINIKWRSVVGENFEKLVAAENSIKTLQTQNASVLDHNEDLENRLWRANLKDCEHSGRERKRSRPRCLRCWDVARDDGHGGLQQATNTWKSALITRSIASRRP